MKLKKSYFMAMSFAAATCSLEGAAVTLNVADVAGTSSFALAGNWNPTGAPSVGNSYSVAVEFLRTPADAIDYTFGGDSLTLNAGGAIIHKGTALTNTYTIANFVLNGGYVRSGAAYNNTLAFAGGLTVNGTGSRFLVDQSPFIINSVVTGTGELTTQGGYPITFTGANTFTGKLTVSNTPVAAAATLAENSHWKFVVGANGVNNTITGTGFVTLNGVFDLDLAAASTTIGDHWILVDAATLGETYGAGFSIAGFTENEGVWTDPTGKYQFRESTGVLTVVTTDTDGDGLPDVWETKYFGSLDAGPRDDNDGDGANNLLEYQSGTDPSKAASFPDTDQDGLNDGWEITYFGNLESGPDEDPDGDYVSNLDEYLSGSSPLDPLSYPDDDGDGINDGWEIHYFGSTTACNPNADLDGDTFTNLEEFQASTDPKEMTSSPDTDEDGLADGWEYKYFRVGTESIEAAITRQTGTDDPDGDAYDNLAEFLAATNPKDASAHPGELAYWRFEEATSGPVPSGAAGGDTPDTVLDSSGIGNHMLTWLDYTAPIYSPTVPFATVPLTGTTNTASLAFTRDPVNNFITDNIYTNNGAYVNQYKFNAFTVEATFNTSATNLWQVVIGKSGNPINGQSPFTMKIDTTNHLRAGIVDGAGIAQEAISTRSITAGTWYSVAITASATELKLWIKTEIDAKYVLEATTPISGAFYDYAGVNAPWVIGLGKWNGADADPFGGNIDEVRISPKVLDSTAFLVPDAVLANDSDNDGMDDAWERTHFGSLDETAEGDYDGDYASNFLEFKSGTDPDNVASYPDTDGDGLGDGWEYRYFGNLAQTAEGDPDGDYATNLYEFRADSNPTDKFSYPDTDEDGINDGWEFHYFGTGISYAASLVACNPAADADGDLFSNLEEFQSTTDPLVQFSSPDTDVDGLPDGWEVKYFRVGTEDLAAAIDHQGSAGDPDGDHLSNNLELKAGTNPADATSGDPTLGYWRFEEMVAGEVPAGGNGLYAFPTSITDSSSYGNPMMAWADYSRPNYVAEVPAPVVPTTGAANTASLYFLRNGNDPRYFIESVFTTPANLLPAGQGFLRTLTLPEYTVEASFNTPLTGVWQVPVCKTGNPIGGQPPFSLKVDTTNKLRAGIVDGSGVAREIISTTTIAAGSWYSAAVTATATELKLWLKGPADTSYRLEGQLTISGAWYVPAAGPLDTIWNIGGGQWAGAATDAFQGEIDEVRLSAVALEPEKFLFYTASSGSDFDSWAEANIADASQRGETDDADGDGTSNLTEFRLGLNPSSGSSRFSVIPSADGTMTWPSATGVIFSVQRSTSMGAESWTKIATVPGTAGTATYKDPAPPAGKAFYRILLEP